MTAAHATCESASWAIGDMLPYGTQYDGLSLRRELRLEVEPFEMLEMVQRELDYIAAQCTLEQPCDEEIVRTGVRYALAIAQKIEERGFDATSLRNEDDMKKLLGFPPAMVFMMLFRRCAVLTTPEKDVMGNAAHREKIADLHGLPVWSYFKCAIPR